MHQDDISNTFLKKSKNLFDSVYLFLLIDQHEEGLWGKSLTPSLLKSFSRIEEAQTAEMQKRTKSISATFHAVDAIYTFTKDRRNPAIERTFDCLPDHREATGSYGTFGNLVSAYPTPQYQILVNCRHTATALLTYFLFQEKIDEKIAESVRFLIDHQKDGGWGVTADLKKEDSECLSTSYVVRLLILTREKGIKEFLSKSYSLRLDKAINNGLDWLKRHNAQHSGFWIFPKDNGDKNVQYSAAVLAIFPELRSYLRELYEETLGQIESIQQEDGGWPASVEGTSEMKPTIYALNALVSSNKDDYTEQIEKGIDFIIQNIAEPSYTQDIHTVDWALLLKLVKYININIAHQSDYEIRNIANEIRTEFDNGNTEFVKKLPNCFHNIEQPLLNAFKNYHPDILHLTPLLKESIIITGGYDDECLNELVKVKEYLVNEKYYKAYLVRDLPNVSKVFEEKEKLCMLSSKFTLWIYRGPTWAVSEYEYAKDLKTVMAILAPRDLGLSLDEQIKITGFGWMKVFLFHTSPFEVIDSALEWAEKFVAKRRGLEKNKLEL